ncbi:hypothetical protein EJ04DRAFT_558028 [Polyplosphaeria fusca]|uniref:Uncharacterized protein n=1 Tax=Polyplosphaeria fusca TaxID=682080 RepID=A0A9P4R8S5_9PLEO|nr:hypothetical protein EJ04DRAFT_558028 [Polyplosphaeria fusca]
MVYHRNNGNAWSAAGNGRFQREFDPNEFGRYRPSQQHQVPVQGLGPNIPTGPRSSRPQTNPDLRRRWVAARSTQPTEHNPVPGTTSRPPPTPVETLPVSYGAQPPAPQNSEWEQQILTAIYEVMPDLEQSTTKLPTLPGLQDSRLGDVPQTPSPSSVAELWSTPQIKKIGDDKPCPCEDLGPRLRAAGKKRKKESRFKKFFESEEYRSCPKKHNTFSQSPVGAEDQED